MNWKDYLRMTLAALLPLTYSLFIKNNPDFPLTEEQWLETIIWIIGAFIGGWESMKFKIRKIL